MADHLKARLAPGGTKRILALDGGGSRGVMTCGVLEVLEEELIARSGNRDLRLCDYFDLIGGTSTGSIIATALALGWRARDLTKLYFDLCPVLFANPPPGPLRAVGFVYSNAPLKKELEKHFGKRTLGTRDFKTGLAIHMKRIDSGSAWTVVNNPNWKYANDQTDNDGNVIGKGNLRFMLRDLVQASAAAPTYFAEVQINLAEEGSRATERGYFIDGGASPNNNPALQMLLTVTDPAFGFNWETGADKLMMLSIGTGYVRKRFDNKNPALHTSAKGIAAFQSLGPVEKLKAVVDGFNHDFSLQQISLMQAISRPKYPWFVNGEIEMQIGSPFLTKEPVLDFQRIDARLERCRKDDRRPEHLESLLDTDLSALAMEKLRRMDIKDANALEQLHNAGKALAKAHLISRDASAGAPIVGANYPPPAFNPGAWTQSAAPSA